MRKQLTVAMIEKLKAPDSGRLEIFDSIVPAMAIRVTSKGAKTFVVRCRIKGEPDPIRVTIGDAEALELTKARDKASAILKECRVGIDPRESKAEAEKAKAEEKAVARESEQTFSAIAEEFIKEHVSKLRSAKNTESEIRRYLIAAWGHRSAASITVDDVAEEVAEIAEDHPHMARLVLAHAKVLFRWASSPRRPRAKRLKVNPCLGLSAKKDFGLSTVRRTVTLGDEHLRLFWKATGELGEPHKSFFRGLLISGQRRNEVARLSWPELALERDRVWNIPAERMKGKRPHEVPLSQAMLELLLELRKERGKEGEYVFSTSDGKHPIGAFSKAKRALVAKIAELRAKELEEAAQAAQELPHIEPVDWRIHDLRRTMRTHLGALPVPHDVRELVIAHVPAPLVATYDQHAYRDEKRQALELWAQRLLSIVEPGSTGDRKAQEEPAEPVLVLAAAE